MEPLAFSAATTAVLVLVAAWETVSFKRWQRRQRGGS
jgi:hypothetical protein